MTLQDRIVDAYRILTVAYPMATHPKTRKPITAIDGKAKLRALARELRSDADLNAALALLPDEEVRTLMRQGLLPMLSFTPQEPDAL